MKHVQSIIVIVIVAVFTDVVILCCRFYRLPFLPVAVFSVALFTVADLTVAVFTVYRCVMSVGAT